jgi:hypothetical protein
MLATRLLGRHAAHNPEALAEELRAHPAVARELEERVGCL